IGFEGRPIGANTDQAPALALLTQLLEQPLASAKLLLGGNQARGQRSGRIALGPIHRDLLGFNPKYSIPSECGKQVTSSPSAGYPPGRTPGDRGRLAQPAAGRLRLVTPRPRRRPRREESRKP